MEYVKNEQRNQVQTELFRFRRVLDVIKKLKIMEPFLSRWMDLGCNNGMFLNLLVKQYPIQTLGVDVYDPKLKGAESWEYLQKDISQDWGLDQVFDVISAMEVLEHMVDTDRFLNSVYSHLKKDGFLVLTTPNINSLRNRITTFWGVYPVGLEYQNIIHHVRLYNLSKLKKHLKEHHFRTVYASGVSFLPLFMSQNLILNKLSILLAEWFPQLCNNLILIGQRVS